MSITACVRVAACIAVTILTTVSPAFAQGYGVRGGVNVNPDQFYGGAQYEVAPVFENVWLTPSVDAGFGNDATLIAINMDFLYRRPVGRRSPWTAHLGGGPTLNHYRLPLYSQTETGLNAVAALAHTSGWFTEVRLGFLDSPEVRFGVGYRITRPARPTRTAKPRSK